MAIDLSTEYLWIDDPLTVTYAVKTAEGTWANGQFVPYAQRSAPSLKDFKADPAIQKTDAFFHLWTANLNGIVPRMGDKLTDPAGVVWVVREVDLLDRDVSGVQRYRCRCIAQLV
ncbi:hypothetical protein [Frigoriglobus tundricola]|uniref:Uncharacterized protein n=1 Tax=Frigoriglobus tundricola TaxID=2774151 RepID=A0A6M5YXH8_9BACT|nr:hypothetical protein [Frigoriglobus tundricola]QJW98685.1 hypothetical protein FTUN_6280 [Frigoriglobus tundricola]